MVNKGSHFADFVRFRPHNYYSLHAHSTISAVLMGGNQLHAHSTISVALIGGNKRLWHRYFPVHFVKFLKTHFLQNTSRRLLLNKRYCLRHLSNLFTFKVKHIFVSKLFLPSSVIEQNNLDSNVKMSLQISAIQSKVIVEISILNYHNPNEIKLPITLRLAFSHFLYHKFKREFQDTFSLFCSCDNDIELLTNIAFTVPTVLKKEQLYWIKSKISMKTS